METIHIFRKTFYRIAIIRTQFPHYLDAIREYEKNPQVKASFIFEVIEVMLAGGPSWIIVREYEDGEFFLHSISDRLDIKNLIK